MPFSEVRPKKAFVYVAEQINEAVSNREFAPGDMLPHERDLAQKFGVSRQVIREALAALQLAGVVETRAGLGTVVRQTIRQDARARIWLLDDEESPGEVLQARQTVEPAIARLAATRFSSESRERLAAILEPMRQEAERAARGEANRFGALDLDFHRELARASGNSVLIRFMEAVIGYVNQQLWRAIREQAYARNRQLASIYLRHHEVAFRALIAGDGDAAARVVRQHLDEARAIWFGESGEDDRNG